MYSQSDPALDASSAGPGCILPEISDVRDEDDVVEGASPRSMINRTVESLDWLNDITRAIWPHVCAIVTKGAIFCLPLVAVDTLTCSSRAFLT